MTISNMTAALHRGFLSSGHIFFCSNTFCLGKHHTINKGITTWGEADFLSITPNDAIVECEIKRSMADFKADFKKKYKHLHLSGKGNDPVPVQYFYYVCPSGMLTIDDMPPYAGLIYIESVYRDGGTIAFSYIKKRAPQLNKGKATDEIKLKMYKTLQKKYFGGLSVTLKQKK